MILSSFSFTSPSLLFLPLFSIFRIIFIVTDVPISHPPRIALSSLLSYPHMLLTFLEILLCARHLDLSPPQKVAAIALSSLSTRFAPTVLALFLGR